MLIRHSRRAPRHTFRSLAQPPNTSPTVKVPYGGGMPVAKAEDVKLARPSFGAGGVTLKTRDGHQLFVSTDPYKYSEISQRDIERLELDRSKCTRNKTGPHQSTLIASHVFYVLELHKPGVRHNVPTRGFVVAREKINGFDF